MRQDAGGTQETGPSGSEEVPDRDQHPPHLRANREAGGHAPTHRSEALERAYGASVILSHFEIQVASPWQVLDY